METIKEINPFKDQDIVPIEQAPATDERFGTTSLSNVKEMQVGWGDTVFRADQSGIWLGAKRFEDAPFSVSMDGQITATGLTLSSLSGNLDDIDDGSVYKRAVQNQLTGADRAFGGLNSSGEIIKGFLNSQLSSKSLPANGVRIDDSGIYGRKAGSTTFYINNNGDAYFTGDIVSSTMTAGAVNGAIVTGGILQTSSSGIRVVIGPSSIYSSTMGTNVDGIAFRNGSTYYGGIYPYFASSFTGMIIGDEADSFIDISDRGLILNGTITSPDNAGSVSSGGGGSLPSGWSAVNIATGRYTVTHNLNTTFYTVVVTPVVSIAKVWSIESKGSNSFTVRIANTSFSLENNPFDFILLKQ